MSSDPWRFFYSLTKASFIVIYNLELFFQFHNRSKGETMTIKRETVTPAEQEATRKPERNSPAFVGVMIVAALFVAATLYISLIDDHPERRWVNGQHEDQWKAEQSAKKELQEKYNPSFEQAMLMLQEIAYHGCEASEFESCIRPSVAKQHVLDAMDREKIAFGTRGVTQAKLDELETKAEVRIASQKLAYLKANGGVKLPSDLKLLSDVCMQVYVYNRKFLGDNPTDEELKQLLPSGITKVDWCYWPGWYKN